jgi:hypothetical protein
LNQSLASGVLGSVRISLASAALRPKARRGKSRQPDRIRRPNG